MTGSPEHDRRRKKRTTWIVLSASLVLYVGSYLLISRLRAPEYAAYKIPGFRYVSLERLRAGGEAWQALDELLFIVFLPVNHVDHHFFGFPRASSVMWHFAPKSKV